MNGYYGPTNLGHIGVGYYGRQTNKLKGSPKGEGMIQNLFSLSRNSAVEFFSDTEAVVGSNPTVTT